MKCGACGYDEALPFRKIEIIARDFPKGQIIKSLFSCPKCGTVRFERGESEKPRNKFADCICLFCGNTSEDEFAIVVRKIEIATHDENRYKVECSCGARGPEADLEESAILKFMQWRRRK